jgi:hypothetical protein
MRVEYIKCLLNDVNVIRVGRMFLNFTYVGGLTSILFTQTFSHHGKVITIDTPIYHGSSNGTFLSQKMSQVNLISNADNGCVTVSCK